MVRRLLEGWGRGPLGTCSKGVLTNTKGVPQNRSVDWLTEAEDLTITRDGWRVNPARGSGVIRQAFSREDDPMLSLFTGPLLIACAHAPVEEVTEEKFQFAYREQITDDGSIRVSIDIDDDGRPDVLNYFQDRDNAPRLLVKEVDLNRDGFFDSFTYYVDGVIERQEVDENFDQTIDRIDHYQGGRKVLTERDTRFTGTLDQFRYFEQGSIARKRGTRMVMERSTSGSTLTKS